MRAMLLRSPRSPSCALRARIRPAPPVDASQTAKQSPVRSRRRHLSAGRHHPDRHVAQGGRLDHRPGLAHRRQRRHGTAGNDLDELRSDGAPVTATGTRACASGSVGHVRRSRPAPPRSPPPLRATRPIGTRSSSPSGGLHGAIRVVAEVTVTPNPPKVATSTTYQLVGQAYNSAGTVITAAKLACRSTDDAALSVSATGVVSAAGLGTANIKARSPNGKMAWSTVTDTGGVASSTPVPPQARHRRGRGAVWSDQFVGSVGVATHFNYCDLLPYGSNRNSTISAIKAGGFRFVRDGLSVDVNSGLQ